MIQASRDDYAEIYARGSVIWWGSPWASRPRAERPREQGDRTISGPRVSVRARPGSLSSGHVCRRARTATLPLRPPGPAAVVHDDPGKALALLTGPEADTFLSFFWERVGQGIPPLERTASRGLARTVRKAPDGRVAVIITLPAPEHPPEAYFVAAVFTPGAPPALPPPPTDGPLSHAGIWHHARRGGADGALRLEPGRDALQPGGWAAARDRGLGDRPPERARRGELIWGGTWPGSRRSCRRSPGCRRRKSASPSTHPVTTTSPVWATAEAVPRALLCSPRRLLHTRPNGAAEVASVCATKVARCSRTRRWTTLSCGRRGWWRLPGWTRTQSSTAPTSPARNKPSPAHHPSRGFCAHRQRAAHAAKAHAHHRRRRQRRPLLPSIRDHVPCGPIADDR